MASRDHDLAVQCQAETETLRRAFIAGWWVNAAEPEVNDAASKEYFDGAAEADFHEWLSGQARFSSDFRPIIAADDLLDVALNLWSEFSDTSDPRLREIAEAARAALAKAEVTPSSAEPVAVKVPGTNKDSFK